MIDLLIGKIASKVAQHRRMSAKAAEVRGEMVDAVQELLELLDADGDCEATQAVRDKLERLLADPEAQGG